MSPYSTTTLASAASSETAIECSQTQLPKQSGSTKAVKSSKKDQSVPKQFAPETKQVIAGELDGFFAASPVSKPKPAAPKRSSRTQQHLDRNRDLSTPSPPPYEAPAHLAPTSKPMTIARNLFLYGFLFPPFWVIGACIILSPLRSDPIPELEALPKDVEAGYAAPSPAYQRAEHRLTRQTELMWAKRCLYAAVAFIAIVIIVIIATRVAGVGAFAHK